MPERDQALAASIVAHVRKECGVPTVPLVNHAVSIFQCFDQLALTTTRILHEFRAILTRCTGLLFRLARIVRVASLRSEIQNSDSVA